MRLSSVAALASPAYWRSVGWAMLRTAIAGFVPFLPAVAATPTSVDLWLLIVGTVGLLLVIAVLTSLEGMPAQSADAPWWQVLTSRGLRQFGQFAIAGVGTATVLAQVDWVTVLWGAAVSAVSTVLIGALSVMPGAENSEA